MDNLLERWWYLHYESGDKPLASKTSDDAAKVGLPPINQALFGSYLSLRATLFAIL